MVSNLSEEHTEILRFEDTLMYTYETTRRSELEYQYKRMMEFTDLPILVVEQSCTPAIAGFAVTNSNDDLQVCAHLCSAEVYTHRHTQQQHCLSPEICILPCYSLPAN